MQVLVVNAGSTSLKCKLFSMPEEKVLAKCRIESINDGSKGHFTYEDHLGKRSEISAIAIPTYKDALRLFLKELQNVVTDIESIERVGFKTVLSKGFHGVHVLREDVLNGMREMMTVAPAHNGPYLAVIEQMRELLPKAVFVGAFETAFHETIPFERRVYGIPYEWTEKYEILRMGYHGASHEYSTRFVEGVRGTTGRMISCHLGGSGSLCAINDGKSVDTSFGLSLQTGLIQSSRVGDLDAFTLFALMKNGMDAAEIEKTLSKNGGLKGISGVSGDLRDVYDAAQAGNERAKLAIDVYCNGILKYIGAFAAELGGLDCLSFTGGIGENAFWLRKTICEKLGYLGVELDEQKNAEKVMDRDIASENSKVRVYVIAADEEVIVARKAFAV